MSRSQKIDFITGKGGVGKSAVAAALALSKAEAGEKVLLVEIGETSYYQEFFELEKITHEGVASGLGFDIALWSGESCLKEYVRFYLRLEKLLNLFFENNVMRALINVAPGLAEIAILGKITSGIRKVGPALDYDRIVVDCFATGHAEALIRAPRGMMEAIRFGPMGKHSAEMSRVLRNSDICSFVIVSLLEEMPVIEALELKDIIARELGVEPWLVANKVVEMPVERASLDHVSGSHGIEDFARYLIGLDQRQKDFLQKLTTQSPRLSVEKIPLVFSAVPKEITRACAQVEFLRKI